MRKEYPYFILHQKEREISQPEQRKLPQVGEKIKITESEHKGNRTFYCVEGVVAKEYENVLLLEIPKSNFVDKQCFRKNDLKSGFLRYEIIHS